MSLLAQDAFLKRIHGHALLQRRMREPGILEVAVAMAPQEPATALEGGVAEEIDLDGDGLPDAIRVDGTWVLKPLEN